MSPRVAHDTLACIGARDVGELAFERRGAGAAVQPFYLGGGRGQCGIGRLRRAVDDKGRARQRLEYGAGRTDRIEIMCPGGADGPML